MQSGTIGFHGRRTTKITEQTQLDDLTPEERWSLVQRVAASQLLRRSARLRDLLIYAGKQSIFETNSKLHENEIGHTVFGRDSDYDTSQDNIVRVNFTELRKRIQQYFETEGTEEPFLFDIPKGSYALRFSVRKLDAFDRAVEAAESAVEAPPSGAEPDAENAPVSANADDSDASNLTATRVSAETNQLSATSFSNRLPLLCLSIVTVLSLVTAGYLWQNNRKLSSQLKPWAATPGLEQFWSPFFESRAPVDVVLADSSIALAQDLTHQQVSLSDYISYNHQDLLSSKAGANEQLKADLHTILARYSGSVGDFRVASLVRALAPLTSTQLFFAREYSPTAVREHSSIIIGSRRSNPWVELFEDRLQYKSGFSEDRTKTFITVLHPQGTEQQTYESISDPSTRVGYSLIAVLPNPSDTGHTMIIAGTDSQATEAAGEVLTTERTMQDVIRATGGKNLSHIQILLRTEKVRGTPMGAKVISYRTDF